MTTSVIENWLKLIEDDWRNPPPDYGYSTDEDDDRPCQYPVSMGQFTEASSDCGRPYNRWIWWQDYNSGMYVCEEHFRKLEESDD